MLLSLLIAVQLVFVDASPFNRWKHHHSAFNLTAYGSEGGVHQAQLQSLLEVLSTPEVRESEAAAAKLTDLMHMQSRTGVIYATTRAKTFGFTGAGDPFFGNLGQGAPETTALPGQPQRNLSISCDDETNEYADVNGRSDLRDAVAAYYNENYRAHKQSKYTRANVAIVPGGRAGISRLMATLHNLNIGYFLPEYTAYTQLLAEFDGVSAIPLHHDNGDTTSPRRLREAVRSHGLGAILFSNPSNPTGQVIEGDTLAKFVDIARSEHCLMIHDEFYSHYIYGSKKRRAPFPSFSAAEFINDVNVDPCVIINGLTKNWRLPGFRVCWVVGPAHCIETLSSVGSFMDGGANNVLQKAAIPLLDPNFVQKDALALQTHFRKKRNFMVKELRKLDIKVKSPEATFYLWADVSELPPPLNSGTIFFEYCVRHKVIVVPGIFFDVNPKHRRKYVHSPFHDHLRMSFGPSWDNLKLAIKGMSEVIELAKKGQLKPLSDY